MRFIAEAIAALRIHICAPCVYSIASFNRKAYSNKIVSLCHSFPAAVSRILCLHERPDKRCRVSKKAVAKVESVGSFWRSSGFRLNPKSLVLDLMVDVWWKISWVMGRIKIEFKLDRKSLHEL